MMNNLELRKLHKNILGHNQAYDLPFQSKFSFIMQTSLKIYFKKYYSWRLRGYDEYDAVFAIVYLLYCILQDKQTSLIEFKHFIPLGNNIIINKVPSASILFSTKSQLLFNLISKNFLLKTVGCDVKQAKAIRYLDLCSYQSFMKFMQTRAQNSF